MIRPAADTDPVPPPGAESPDGPERLRAGDAGPCDHDRSFKTLMAQALEFLAHAREASIELAKAKLARKLRTAAVAALGAVAGIAFVVTAVVLFLGGLAGALNALLGQAWAGPLIVGGLVLAACALGPKILFKRQDRAAAKRVEAKYAARQAAQRERFGTDAASLAAAARSEGGAGEDDVDRPHS